MEQLKFSRKVRSFMRELVLSVIWHQRFLKQMQRTVFHTLKSVICGHLVSLHIFSFLEECLYRIQLMNKRNLKKISKILLKMETITNASHRKSLESLTLIPKTSSKSYCAITTKECQQKKLFLIHLLPSLLKRWSRSLIKIWF